MAWAKAREKASSFRLVGIQHINSLLDEEPSDGAELDGRFYDAIDVWKRAKSLIPRKREIPIIRLERHPHTPLTKLMTSKQKRDLKAILE